MKKYLFYLMFATILVLLSQCKDDCQTIACKGDLFIKRNEKDSSELSIVFKLGKTINLNGKCKYDHEFTFWRGVAIGDKPWPYQHLKGNIYKLGEAVYFEIDSGNTFKYFDFGMSVNQSEPIVFFKYAYNEYSKKDSKLQWEYDLILEDKFLDAEIGDTVYKFRFSKIGLQLENTDLVFYICKDYGLIGGYHAGLLEDGTEEMFSSVGNIYLNIDKKHIRRSSKGNIL